MIFAMLLSVRFFFLCLCGLFLNYFQNTQIITNYIFKVAYLKTNGNM